MDFHEEDDDIIFMTGKLAPGRLHPPPQKKKKKILLGLGLGLGAIFPGGNFPEDNFPCTYYLIASN